MISNVASARQIVWSSNGGILALGVYMAARYKEVPREDVPRSIWSTTGIFIALGVLTMLMALLVYSAIQGVSSPGPIAGERGPAPVRATR